MRAVAASSLTADTQPIWLMRAVAASSLTIDTHPHLVDACGSSFISSRWHSPHLVDACSFISYSWHSTHLVDACGTEKRTDTQIFQLAGSVFSLWIIHVLKNELVTGVSHVRNCSPSRPLFTKMTNHIVSVHCCVRYMKFPGKVTFLHILWENGECVVRLVTTCASKWQTIIIAVHRYVQCIQMLMCNYETPQVFN